jgi:hypothetical protein
MVDRYKRAVFEATDAYLGSLLASDLWRVFNLSGMGHGEVSLAWIVSHMLIARAYEACAEVHRVRDLYGQI